MFIFILCLIVFMWVPSFRVAGGQNTMCEKIIFCMSCVRCMIMCGYGSNSSDSRLKTYQFSNIIQTTDVGNFCTHSFGQYFCVLINIYRSNIIVVYVAVTQIYARRPYIPIVEHCGGWSNILWSWKYTPIFIYCFGIGTIGTKLNSFYLNANENI